MKVMYDNCKKYEKYVAFWIKWFIIVYKGDKNKKYIMEEFGNGTL